jgi:glycosyltransferase involved in cell wall biosynthesis
VIAGFDRVLAYTKYGADVLKRTLTTWGEPEKPIGNLPHGIEGSIFYPRDRKHARMTFLSRVSNGATNLPLMLEMVLLAGIGTNSSRKDWGMVFQTAAELRKRNRNVFLWAHTDVAQAHWDLPALIRQFGMENRVVMTTENLSDETMAWAYSAADCSIGLGAGEGMGYPLMESLACQTPVIHGDYAAGAEFVPREYLVKPSGFSIEGRWMMQRPVLNPARVADKVEYALTDEGRAKARLPEDMLWDNLFPRWNAWLRNEGSEHDGI